MGGPSDLCEPSQNSIDTQILHMWGTASERGLPGVCYRPAHLISPFVLRTEKYHLPNAGMQLQYAVERLYERRTVEMCSIDNQLV